MRIARVLAVTFSIFTSSLFGAGEPVGGFPNWAERTIYEWMNRARSDPQFEMSQCPTGDCGEAACYSPRPPLGWSTALSRAARFHAEFLQNNGLFQHDTPCLLVSDLNSRYPYTCNGAAGCSCQGGALGGGVTNFATRVSLFGGSPSSEIIATPADPDSAFYVWLFERWTGTNCRFETAGNLTNGHRWFILTSTQAVGTGVGPIANSVGEFGSGVTPTKLVSGSHYPRGPAASVEAWANWYDTASPVVAQVVVDGVAQNMTLRRGTGLNGAWNAVITGVSSGCHRYFFQFTDSLAQTHRYPTEGTFGIGAAGSCPDWLPGVKADFNRDGEADIAWRNYGTGFNSVWHLDGTTWPGTFTPLTMVSDLNWKMEGVHDLSGDGHDDIIWRNYFTGQNTVWLMTASVWSGLFATLPTVGDLNWRIEGAGDFNGDRHKDLVWRNYATGESSIWYLNGTTWPGQFLLLPVVNVSWVIEAAADFNGDGTPDLLWRNYATGQNSIWLMTPIGYFGTFAALPSVGDPSWVIEAVDDYDGDSDVDILWRNYANGTNSIWRLQGVTWDGSSFALLPNVGDPAWRVEDQQ